MIELDPEDCVLEASRCTGCDTLAVPAERYGCPDCGALPERIGRERLNGPFAAQTVITVHAVVVSELTPPVALADVELAPGLVRQVVLGVPEDRVAPGDLLEMRQGAEGPRFYPVSGGPT